MRDCSKNRAGIDRVLMAVAATFLAVSASSALGQGDPVRNSAAELAIDAAIPRPEPVNLPPPSIKDFKADSNPAAAETATSAEKAAASKPSDVVTSAPADAGTLPAKAAMPAAEPDKEQAKETPKEQKESPKAASNVPPEIGRAHV